MLMCCGSAAALADTPGCHDNCRRKSRPEFGTTDKSLWGTSKGWKSFDVTDELLMGAEEGGFAGLEVLEDVSLIDSGGYVFLIYRYRMGTQGY